MDSTMTGFIFVAIGMLIMVGAARLIGANWF
jgi:hypothetical protein